MGDQQFQSSFSKSVQCWVRILQTSSFLHDTRKPFDVHWILIGYCWVVCLLVATYYFASCFIWFPILLPDKGITHSNAGEILDLTDLRWPDFSPRSLHQLLPGVHPTHVQVLFVRFCVQNVCRMKENTAKVSQATRALLEYYQSNVKFMQCQFFSRHIWQLTSNLHNLDRGPFFSCSVVSL